jgi:hypothetical protein
MIVVTQRGAFADQLRHVLRGPGTGRIPGPFIACTIDQLHVLGTTLSPDDTQLLVLDLGSRTIRDEFVAIVDVWRRTKPWCHPVAVAPLCEPREEYLVAAALMARGPVAHVVRPDEQLTATWERLAAISVTQRVAASLEADLRAALPSGHRFIEERRVLALLHAAPGVTSVTRYCAYSGVERRNLWRRLRQTGQRTTKELIAMFRLLWYTRLGTEGWDPDDRARFLCAPNDARATMALAHRLRTTSAVIRGLTYLTVVAWIARHGVCSADHRYDTRTPPVEFADAVAELVGQARRPA